MLQLKFFDLKKTKTDTLVIPVCEDKDIHDRTIISSFANKAKKLKEFQGKKGDEVVFYNPQEVQAQRVILKGLGKFEKVDLEALRVFAGDTVKKCIKKGLSEVLIAVPSSAKIDLKMSAVLQALMEGGYLANHLFDKYKKEKTHKPLRKMDLHVKPDTAKKFRSLSLQVKTVCEGTILAREWVSMPANDKRPEQFAKAIVNLAGKESLKIKVLDEKILKQKKFGALLAVAAGSQSKPRVVVLEYRPRSAQKTVAFVGKGVTFDSGGINLKPTGALKDMKTDMSGAAVVASLLITIAKLKPKVNVIGVIPIVENMPSGNASRPGDIVKSFDGKTVEIGNTDAEGRLILIDAISYCLDQYKPDTLIDIATLTGACVVALGEKIAGLFSFDDQLAEAIILSGEQTHERCWRMPLPDDYKELIKSDFADIHNMSKSRWGGAITAALFLSEFVGDTRWAHIDIAGPACTERESAYCGVGGTGFGVRLFWNLLDKL